MSQLNVVTRRSHRGGQHPAIEAQLQRFLGGQAISGGAVHPVTTTEHGHRVSSGVLGHPQRATVAPSGPFWPFWPLLDRRRWGARPLGMRECTPCNAMRHHHHIISWWWPGFGSTSGRHRQGTVCDWRGAAGRLGVGDARARSDGGGSSGREGPGRQVAGRATGGGRLGTTCRWWSGRRPGGRRPQADRPVCCRERLVPGNGSASRRPE